MVAMAEGNVTEQKYARQSPEKLDEVEKKIDAVMGKKSAETSLASRFKTKYGEELETPDPAVALIPSVELWPEMEAEKARIDGKAVEKKPEEPKTVTRTTAMGTETVTIVTSEKGVEEEIVIEEPIVAPKSSKLSGFWLGWASFKWFPIWELTKRYIGNKTRGQWISRVIVEIICWVIPIEEVFFILAALPRAFKALGRYLEARKARKYAEQEGLIEDNADEDIVVD